MKAQKLVLSSLAAVALLSLSGCGGSDSTSGGGTTPPPASTTSCGTIDVNVVLSGDITGQTLDSSLTYGINGKVRLTSGELNIPAGTTLAGCSPASYLIIKPNATIEAIGTLADPIVFTSSVDVAGNSTTLATGEWGGLVILGNAYADGAPVSYEAGDIDDTYGTTTHANDAESSGHLEYVVIKHTGYEVEADKELNGLSLGAVGSGTTFDNIAILGGSDDGLEAWGGSPTVNGLYVYNAKDDSVDTDLGCTGTFTDVYVKQAIVDKTNNHDSSAVETGNDTNGVYNTTNPTITNLVAEVVGAGIYMKNDANLNITNAIFTSSKTADKELVFYRTEDVVTNNIVATEICFDNSTLADDAASTYSASNSKDNKVGESPYDEAKTALGDWTTSTTLTAITLDDTTACTGLDTTTIWKGKAGSNGEL